jgi:Cof subfamily protein (haloacid dehalogenase superfamily)
MRLYVSDLDGTLLNSKQEIDGKSIDAINGMIGRGMNFTIATARSYESVRTLTGELHLKLPLILNNGALVYDPAADAYLMKRVIAPETLRELIGLFDREGVSFFVNAFDAAGNSRMYNRGVYNAIERNYVDERLKRGDKRLMLFSDIEELGPIECITFSAFNRKKTVKRMIHLLKGRKDVACHFYNDSYSDGYIVEITDRLADKRTGLEFLRRYLGADVVTCFGDNFNDIGMFKASDRSCAVFNACADLKRIADVVIGSNEKGGVAAYLAEIWPAE